MVFGQSITVLAMRRWGDLRERSESEVQRCIHVAHGGQQSSDWIRWWSSGASLGSGRGVASQIFLLGGGASRAGLQQQHQVHRLELGADKGGGAAQSRMFRESTSNSAEMPSNPCSLHSTRGGVDKRRRPIHTSNAPKLWVRRVPKRGCLSCPVLSVLPPDLI